MLGVFIIARLPTTDDVAEIVEMLRQVAIKAGCAEPRVYMEYPTEPGKSLTIEVTCKEN